MIFNSNKVLKSISRSLKHYTTTVNFFETSQVSQIEFSFQRYIVLNTLEIKGF